MHKIGVPSALDLLLSGKRVTAKEAYQLGLVDHLVSKDAFREEVEAYAKQIAAAPRKAIQTYKEIARKVKRGVPSTDLFELEADSCSTLWETKEHRQAVEAFFKRTRKE
jgi:enoyl-CoA hydratase/carnithine racemase